MQIDNELILAYVEGSLEGDELRDVRNYMCENSETLETVVALMSKAEALEEEEMIEEELELMLEEEFDFEDDFSIAPTADSNEGSGECCAAPMCSDDNACFLHAPSRRTPPICPPSETFENKRLKGVSSSHSKKMEKRQHLEENHDKFFMPKMGFVELTKHELALPNFKANYECSLPKSNNIFENLEKMLREVKESGGEV